MRHVPCFVVSMLSLVILVVGVSLDAVAQPVDSALYENDPAILAILQKLGDNSSATLPAKRGRASNDYSLRMVYAPERQTALYAGGNHNNGRTNDCWEYHLGSNSWHQLHPAEGGDHYFMLEVVQFNLGAAKQVARKNGKVVETLDQYKQYLSAADVKKLEEKIVPWWKEHIVIHDGMIATRNGGPILPSHTWDGLEYDPVNKRMVWVSGAGPHGDVVGFHAMVHGLPYKDIAAKMDPTYTPMWFFDPEAGKWLRYRRPRGICPDFRGMGQSLLWIPDRKIFLWYIAASNVSPDSYQMWSWDTAKDVWQELKPNGGKSIRELVHPRTGTDRLAPPEEQILRYSPKQKKAYGFRADHVYAYDLERNEWSKVCTDHRIAVHDAHSGIAYDSVNDVFIYTRKDVVKDQARLAVFNPTENKWEVPEVQGPALPSPKYAYLKCFFHPVHNVYVAADGNLVWVYRYKNGKVGK